MPAFLCKLPFEAAVWTAGLAALACADPAAEGLLQLCVFKGIGLPGCPGCGLGHAVAYLLDGAWSQALQTHPLAPFAVAVLAGRIATLLHAAYWPGPSEKHSPTTTYV